MELYKKGSRGEVVRQIQKALHLIPDGIFGAITEEAVKDFQKSRGLKADGIVGPATLARLIPFRLKKSRRRIDEIIIHCSATPEGRNQTVDDIRNWHLKQGWSDIGYHYVVDIYGNIFNGRDVDLVGAHCSKGGHNTHSIGVCYVGGVEKDNVKVSKDTRTTLQKASLITLLKDLRALYPNARIYGHRNFDKSKDCPSFDAKKEYRNI
jgi:N-acetylmuramoyl-L-alanine amidase